MGHPTPSALLLLLQGSEGSGCGGMARVMPGPGPPSAQHLRTERSWRRPPAGQATAPHASPETEGRSRGLPFSGFCVFEGRPGWCLFSLTPSVPRTLSVPTPLSACVRSRAGPSSGRLQATGNQTSTVTPPPNPLSQEAPHFTPPLPSILSALVYMKDQRRPSASESVAHSRLAVKTWGAGGGSSKPTAGRS